MIFAWTGRAFYFRSDKSEANAQEMSLLPVALSPNKLNIMKMNRLFFGLTLLSVPCLLGGCMDDDEYTQGVWRRMSDLDGVARSCASSFTIDNKGYLCCGYRGSNRDRLKDLWAYDMDGNYWTQCADMPDAAAGRHSAVAFALNGKGYVTTGAIKEDPYFLADTWEYDPTTDTWQQKDDFLGGIRDGALAFSIGGYGYVGTGYDDNWLKDFYRFDPNAAEGSQWTVVNGFPGYKRRYGSAFVIDDVAYICLGENNGSLVEDFWKFDGSTWTQLRDIADTNSDEDYDDDYAITRYSAVTFVIDNKGYVATGSRSSSGTSSDYWVYYPETDLWYGDSDDDFTPLTEANSGGTSRTQAVSFSTGTRGFVLTGSSGTTYFDDVYELYPYEEEEVD